MIEAAALGALSAVFYLAVSFVAWKGCRALDRMFGGNAAPPPRRRPPREMSDRTVLMIGAVSAAAMILCVWLLAPRHAAGATGAVIVRCDDRTAAAGEFSAQWHERPLLEGLTTSGARVELFASAARTWTFIVTDVQGRACLLAAGTALGPAITIEPEGETP